MPTPQDFHDYLTIVQQVTPSVPGTLPPEKFSDPNITYWVGLIGFVTTVSSAVAYFLGIKTPGAKAEASSAQTAIAAAAAAEAHGPHDPSASMYWDAILSSIFDGIKRCESHALAIAANDAGLREAVLRAAQEARHGVAAHLQQHTAVQERNHDENSHSIENLSREISDVANHLGSQIAGLSGQLNALAVTLGKIETLAEGSVRRSTR